MDRKRVVVLSAVATVLTVVTLLALQAQKPRAGGPATRSGPPLAPAPGASLNSWVKQWQDQLPATAALKKGSQSIMMGIGQFGVPRYDTQRTYTAHIEIQNRTGHSLATGISVYVVETAQKPAPAAKKEAVLEVSGGYFRREPLEDFSGAAGFREERKISDGDADGLDREDFGLLNVLSWSDSGTKISRLGPRISFSTGVFANKLKAPSFGAARPGETLKVDADMELGVMVRRDKQEKVVLISPRLIFGDPQGETASFRYLLEFDAHPRSSEPEGELLLTAQTLLPMRNESLQAVVNEQDGPLWRRVFAAQWAGAFGGEAAAPALAALAGAKGKENDVLRASAILGLGAARQASALDQILALATDQSDHLDVQSAAAKALGRIGDRRATSTLLSIAGGKDQGLARDAIASLGRIKDPAAAEPLLRILEDNGRTELHLPAAEALGKLGGEGSLDGLHRVAKNKRAKGAADAVRAMGGVGGPRAVALLSDVFSSGSDDLRKTVCAALGKIDRPEALAALQSALGDKNKDVREAAVDGIAAINNAERAAALRQVLRSSDLALQKSALRKLADLKVAEAKPEIAALLGNAAADASLRESAATALGSLPGEDTIQTLSKAVGDPAPPVRKAALSSLGKLESKAAAGTVAHALKDSDPEVRAAAARALESIGDKSTSSALVDAVVAEKDLQPLHAQVNALIALEYTDLRSFPQLAGRLRTLDGSGRAALSRLLKHLTGQDVSLNWDAKPDQVEEAIRRWTEAAEKKK